MLCIELDLRVLIPPLDEEERLIPSPKYARPTDTPRFREERVRAVLLLVVVDDQNPTLQLLLDPEEIPEDTPHLCRAVFVYAWSHQIEGIKNEKLCFMVLDGLREELNVLFERKVQLVVVQNVKGKVLGTVDLDPTTPYPD